MLKGKASVEFVRGESYKYEIQFDEVSSQFVSSVCISCKDLSFHHKLTKDSSDGKKWYHCFKPEETKKFKTISTTHSIFVESSVEGMETQILADQPFIVKENKNHCEEV